jgi:hypothetical protein
MTPRGEHVLFVVIAAAVFVFGGLVVVCLALQKERRWMHGDPAATVERTQLEHEDGAPCSQ